MKANNIYISLAATCIMGLSSCELDEFNPSAGYSTLENYDTWKGLQVSCYSTLYHELYSKNDFLFFSECGTDLWLNPAATEYAKEVFYYDGLGVARSEAKKTWQQAYAVISTCNSTINHAEDAVGGSAESKAILVAEAKVIRAFMHLTLVTYYGPIPLCMTEVGEMNTKPKRNSQQEVYASIISDLKAAAADLGDTPYEGNYARVTKKTAYGLLARAYAQGAAEGLSEDGVSYWQRAKEIAEGMINEPTKYGLTGNELYSDVADLWAQDNNRGSKNSEYLFVAAGLDANGTDAALAGSYFNATSYLYAFSRCNPNTLQDLYKTQSSSNVYLGNHNQGGVMAPTKHAIDVFAEWDKRYENTFLTAYGEFSVEGESSSTLDRKTITITSSMSKKYGWGEDGKNLVATIDMETWENDEDYYSNLYPSSKYSVDFQQTGPTSGTYTVYELVPAPAIGKKIYPYAALAKSEAPGGIQIYAEGIYEKGGTGKVIPTKNALVVDMPLQPGEDRIAIYLSKKDLTQEEKLALVPCAVINISELYGNDAEYATDYSESNYRFPGGSLTTANKLFPSLIKYNGLYKGSTRQLSSDGYPFRNPDIAIMRMAEIYMIAAEANVMTGNNGAAVSYIEKLQRRAIRPGFEGSYSAPTSVDEQYILDEYAREFAGEHMRWPVLKRHRSNGLFKQALEAHNKRAANFFDENIHYFRPVSQTFLDQISNKEEFGDNGYGYTSNKGY